MTSASKSYFLIKLSTFVFVLYLQASHNLIPVTCLQSDLEICKIGFVDNCPATHLSGTSDSGSQVVYSTLQTEHVFNDK